jgi:resuscitation-promoting factor RpfB
MVIFAVEGKNILFLCAIMIQSKLLKNFIKRENPVLVFSSSFDVGKTEWGFYFLRKGAFFILVKVKRHVFVIIALSCLFMIFPTYHMTKATVILDVDGKKKEIKTHSNTIREVLDEQNIRLRKEDKVTPSLKTEIHDNMIIELDLARKVTLSMDGKEKEVWTTAETVDGLIREQGITLHPYDQIMPEGDTLVKNGLKVVVAKAIPVRLNDGGTKKEVWTTSATVADFLGEQRIVLLPNDRVEPAPETPLTKNMEISIIRVEKATDVVEETTAFATIYQKDSSLQAGTKEVIQEGEKGLIKNYFEVKRENGKDVSRRLVKKEVVKEPRNRIIAIGTRKYTKPVSRGSRKSVSRNSGKQYIVTATAYTANCDGCSGITATGYNLKDHPDAKIIAVDPNIIPLGSKVWVEGYGYAIAADTGSGIKGYEIDIFVPTEEEAIQFGRRTVRIKVLN